MVMSRKLWNWNLLKDQKCFIILSHNSETFHHFSKTRLVMVFPVTFPVINEDVPVATSSRLHWELTPQCFLSNRGRAHALTACEINPSCQQETEPVGSPTGLSLRNGPEERERRQCKGSLKLSRVLGALRDLGKSCSPRAWLWTLLCVPAPAGSPRNEGMGAGIGSSGALPEHPSIGHSAGLTGAIPHTSHAIQDSSGTS